MSAAAARRASAHIIKQAGVTAVYVTHDQAEAVVLGDRIGVMRDAVADGVPGRMYNRPPTFRGEFHGCVEPAHGRVLERDGELASSTPAGIASRR